MASYPDRNRTSVALDKVEFLVVSDLFMTETAAMADVVLPACSFAEKEGTFTAVDRRVQYFKPAIKKIGLSKSDFEIFSSLINLLGGQAPVSPAAVFADIAANTNGYSGMSFFSNSARRICSGGCQACVYIADDRRPSDGAREACLGGWQCPLSLRHPLTW